MEHRIYSWYRSLTAIFQVSQPNGGEETFSMKKAKIVLLVLAIATALFFLLQAFSMPLAFLFSGLNPKTEYVLAPKGSLDSTDRQFTVVYTKTSSGEHALAELHVNELGFWEVVQSTTLTDEYPYLSFAWTTRGNEQSFHDPNNNMAIPEPLTVNYETHMVIMGNNALKKIEIPPAQVPDGYYIRIYQNGTFYIVEGIEQNKEGSSSSEIYDLLVHSGSVPK